MTETFGFLKSDIKHAFNRSACSYKSCAQLHDLVNERLYECLDLVNIEPERILELGCGIGDKTKLLQQRFQKTFKGVRVFGVDLAEQRVQQGNKNRKWLSKERFVCADAEKLPFADNSFDLIYSNLMLHWIENPDVLFSEINRVLVPNGLVVFSSFGPDTLKEMRASWAAVDNQVHVNRFMDMHDLGDSLTKTGFNGIVVDAEKLTMNYASLDDLHSDLKGLGETNINKGRARGLQGKDKWQQYLAYYQSNFQKQNDCPATWEVIYAHAWAGRQRVKPLAERQPFSNEIPIKSL